MVVPFARRHRHRYHQYLPLDALSTRTTSLRQRIADGLTALVLPSTWGLRRAQEAIDGSTNLNAYDVAGGDSDDDDDLFDAEDGEHLIGVAMDIRRREALDRRRSEVGDNERRLSRDLEEGFRDDSSDEEDTAAADGQSMRR